MNIFVLHVDPKTCARYHVNRHVVKMGMECTQMLCTVMREVVGIDHGYKSTYINHPCTKWVGETFNNFQWTWTLGLALFDEYTYRYGRVHASKAVHHGIIQHFPEIMDSLPKFGMFPLKVDGELYRGMTPFYRAVSARFKDEDAITAYRLYYYYVKERLHDWTGRAVPPFILDRVGGVADKYQLHHELIGE